MSRFTDSKYRRWSVDYYYSNADPAMPFARKDTGVKVGAFDMLKAAFDMGVSAGRDEIRIGAIQLFSDIGLELERNE
jgi:hypothetical protein